jgi:membrane-bound lytic murein transglycosylase A
MRRALVLVGILGCGQGSKPPPDAAVVAVSHDAAPPPQPPPDAAVCECDKPTADTDVLTLEQVGFDALPGWADDDHAEALPSFLRSCVEVAKLDDDAAMGHDGFSGKARDWRRACREAAKVTPGDNAAARAFFEREFTPYAASGNAGREGKFTGYYVETVRASRRRHGPYQVPVYARPKDLVMVDLSDFIKDGRGRRIWGRVDKGELVKYPTSAEIRTGALDGQGLEILWVDDRVSEVFMEIEGSGRAVLDDGSVVWVEFAGKNGRPYRGIGKLLRDLGELKPGEGTMQGIRAWFAAHPDRVDEILDQNPSKVFFSLAEHPGAVGSQQVILTARRSIAVDRAFVAFSTPVWVDTRAPVPGRRGDAPWRSLLIAQDTGGGILGPVRGDIYWGDDEEAAELGGRMGNAGQWWLLLPRSLKVR